MNTDRFKFRVWDAPFSEYIPDNAIDDYKIRNDGKLVYTAGRPYVKSSTIEQCTGLKDKNGKLIYEGDIVTFKEHSYKDSAIVRREVYFDEELCEFGIRCSFALFHAQFGHEFEIIGNIHENGDLLK